MVPRDLPALPEDLGVVMEGYLATPEAQGSSGVGHTQGTQVCHSHSEWRSPRGREGEGEEGDGTTAHSPRGRPGEPGRRLQCGSCVE